MLYRRVPTMRTWLIPLLVVACGKGAEPRARTDSTGTRSVESSRTTSSRVNALVDRLRSKDEQVRSKARNELEPGSFSGDEALEVLRASTLDFGDSQDALLPTSAQLVLAAKPEPRVTSLVDELFPKWPAAAKAAGLDLLSRIGDDESTKVFVRLLPTCPSDQIGFALRSVRTKPHHAEQVVPALLALNANDAAGDEVHLTLLSYCDEGQLKPPLIAAHAPVLLASYRRAIQEVKQRQRDAGWARDAAYDIIRERASLLLDLARCVPADELVTELSAALSNRDARLVFFAAKSLRALGRDVPNAALARIGASAEMRNWLIEELARTHDLAKLPERYRSQAAIAESEMVQWLTFPTELGHVPEAIELAKVVGFASGNGPVDLYVFKIKTDDGWVAGVAGPYLRDQEPTTESLGDTFSAFEPWSAKTPEQHAAELSHLLEKARTQSAGRDKALVPGSDARDRTQGSGVSR